MSLDAHPKTNALWNSQISYQLLDWWHTKELLVSENLESWHLGDDAEVDLGDREMDADHMDHDTECVLR
jgi:hypothetical protein